MTVVKATPRFFFQYLQQGVGEGVTSFPPTGLLHFTLDPNLIMLRVKPGGINIIFWVCGMTWRGIEPWSLGPLSQRIFERARANFLRTVKWYYTVRWSNNFISNNSIKPYSFVCTQFKYQTVLFDQWIRPYQVLTLWDSNLGAMAIKVLKIPKSSNTTASISDCLMLYPETLVGGRLTSLQRCSWCILQS